MDYVFIGKMVIVHSKNRASLHMKKSPNATLMAGALEITAAFSIPSRNPKIPLLFYTGGASRTTPSTVKGEIWGEAKEDKKGKWEI